MVYLKYKKKRNHKGTMLTVSHKDTTFTTLMSGELYLPENNVIEFPIKDFLFEAIYNDVHNVTERHNLLNNLLPDFLYRESYVDLVSPAWWEVSLDTLYKWFSKPIPKQLIGVEGYVMMELLQIKSLVTDINAELLVLGGFPILEKCTLQSGMVLEDIRDSTYISYYLKDGTPLAKGLIDIRNIAGFYLKSRVLDDKVIGVDIANQYGEVLSWD